MEKLNFEDQVVLVIKSEDGDLFGVYVGTIKQVDSARAVWALMDQDDDEALDQFALWLRDYAGLELISGAVGVAEILL